jgi:hypothetical protein
MPMADLPRYSTGMLIRMAKAKNKNNRATAMLTRCMRSSRSAPPFQRQALLQWVNPHNHLARLSHFDKQDGPPCTCASRVSSESSCIGRYATNRLNSVRVANWRVRETDTIDKMEGRIKHDLFYLEHWSIWLDLKIIFLTPLATIQNKNVF